MQRHLGQFSPALTLRTPLPAAPTPKPAAAPLAPLKASLPAPLTKLSVTPMLAAKPGVVAQPKPAARPIVTIGPSVVAKPGVVAKPVTSEERALATSKMALNTANKIRAIKVKSPAGVAQQSLDAAETKVRGLVFGLPTKRLSLAQAVALVDEARGDVSRAKLAGDVYLGITSALVALRAAIAPPVSSKVTALSKSAVTATQATAIQGAVDAAISKLASSGVPLTEVTVKQTASEILKDVAPDAAQTGALKTATLVLTGTAKTNDTVATETLSTTPLPIESVAALVQANETAPAAPEPEQAAAAETPSDEKSASEPATVTSLVAPAEAAKSEGLFGVPWLYVGIGAGVLAVGGVILATTRRKAPTPNRRKRSRKRRSR